MTDDRDYDALAAKLAEVEAVQDTLIDWMKERKQAADRIKKLEAKLAQGTIVEYDDGSRVSLSAFAGGASEGGAWSHLTLMKEEQDGAVSFRHYTADGGWCSPRVHSTLAELKGQDNEWKCPINYTGCTKNCGSYGCGN